MKEVMEYELKTKKKHLAKLQEYFKTDTKDINSPNYEDNAINSLLEMKKIKVEIAQLEYYLQMKWLIYIHFYTLFNQINVDKSVLLCYDIRNITEVIILWKKLIM